MHRRTFAFGDIHGDLDALFRLLSILPELTAADTLVFLGDYIDCGPSSAEVIEYLRALPKTTAASVVTLRGNHEDGWLRAIDEGWPEFLLPGPNGCMATVRSFLGKPPAKNDGKYDGKSDEPPNAEEFKALLEASFFPPDVVEWMRALPYYYEDQYAIYVHAGLPKDSSDDTEGKAAFLHPSAVKNKIKLLWLRDEHFFRNYRGKLVVFGHTATKYLPPELSTFTPEDPTDLWAGPSAVGLDTRCGKGGYLTALELPSRHIYTSQV